MSDDEEYEYEYDEDASDEEMADGGNDEEEEEDAFEYTDDEEEADDVDVALENAYYNAKGTRDTDLIEAAEAFEGVIHMEQEALGGSSDGDGVVYGPWTYKSLKQLVKLHFLLLQSQKTDGDKVMKLFDRLLKCIASGAVSPNAVEKGISGMLERVSSLYQGIASGETETAVDLQLLAKSVYDATLRVFHPWTGSSPNERLWFKTNLKYGQLLYEMNETVKLQLVIRDLLPSSGDASGMSAEDSSSVGGGSSTHLMEIYALQIQLYSRQKDNKKLREIFTRAMRVQGGIPHPRTLAQIQELGGKMHMASREFESAGKTFFQAFKSYDEAGDPSRLRCLKYLVMASMLHASTINPFDSQEARPYRDDPEIVAMTNLVQAFHNNEIKRFEAILRRNEGKLMDDEFVREHVEELLRTIRTQVLQQVIGPYTRISLEAIARELNGIPVSSVESLLVSLILDGKLNARIDQVQGVLLKSLERSSGTATAGASHSAGPGGDASAGDTSAMTAMSSSATAAAGGGKHAWLGTEGNTIEARNCKAIDQLTMALETLTTAVTSVGSKSNKII